MKVVSLVCLLVLVCFSASAQQTSLDGSELNNALAVFLDGTAEERAQAIRSLETLGKNEADKLVVYSVLKAYGTGTLYWWNGKAVFTDTITQDENYVKFIRPVDVITGEASPTRVKLKEVKTLAADRNDRDLVSDSLLFVGLGLGQQDLVVNSVQRMASIARSAEAVPALEALARDAKDQRVRRAAEEGLGLIGLRVASQTNERIAWINLLGTIPSLKALPILVELKAVETDALTLAALNRAIGKIREYEGWVSVFDILKSSLSSGSILILMAMGLAITFGMMGVINMAHGEMMMIGAYTTYCVQMVFGHSADHPAPEFFLVALPLSFLVAALVGGLIEGLVVRHLYKKPIESLLATYGVSLILTQVVRLVFGDNRATNSPDWLQGAVAVAQGMDIPANRFFILVVAVFSVLLVLFIFRCTKVGLNMKATMQNRDMAAAMGINTRGVDSFTFMLGSGIAGIAGYALTTVGGITPDMGKNYIIDSFLIVVTGGAGSIAGVVVSGAGIGFLNKFLEGTFFGTVWAKIIVLALVMTFIQFKPSGIFAPKGRLADD